MRHRRYPLAIAALLAATLLLAGCSDDTDDAPDENNGNNAEMDAGEDVGEAPEDAEGTPDAEEDAAEDVVEEGLVLDQDFVESFCETWCAEGIAECAPEPEIGEDTASCESFCEESLGEEGAFLANHACYEESCDFDLCFGDDVPLDEEAVCDDLCVAFDDCDLLGAIEIPEDRPDICRALCSGVVVGQPGAESAFECFTESLGDTCDIDAAGRCFEQRPQIGCEAICGSFFDPESDQACAPDSPLRQVWETPEACLAECGELDEPQHAVFFACVLFGNCGDPTVCNDLPDGLDPGCNDACGEVADLCEGVEIDGPDITLCPELCTGFLARNGVEAGAEDAGECVAALEACPEDTDDGAVFGAVIGCVLPLSEACEAICQALGECNEEAGEGCPQGCTNAEFMDPDLVVAVGTCIEEADGACEAILACVPGDGE